VAAVDGKGIPMIKPQGRQRALRRTKGQKANRKKMATVAAVFTRAPWIRTPEQVVESLFGRDPSPQNPPPPRPEHQRLWASLTQGKDTVMGEVAAEVLRRELSCRCRLARTGVLIGTPRTAFGLPALDNPKTQFKIRHIGLQPRPLRTAGS